jgi:hypothetical protein
MLFLTQLSASCIVLHQGAAEMLLKFDGLGNVLCFVWRCYQPAVGSGELLEAGVA